jgi:hypothetical protein
MRPSRRALGTVAAIIALPILAYGALRLSLNSTRFQAWLTAEVARRTGYQLAGEFRFDSLLRLNARAFSVARNDGTILRGEGATLTITPLGLFSGTVRRLRLERPIVYLDLNDLIKQTSEQSFGFRVRHLEIQDGTLALAIGAGAPLEFKSLSARAENLSLGKAADLRLRADVPSLDAVAELFATGAESEKTLRLELVQRESPGEDPGPGASSEAGTVNGEIRFGSDPEQTMPITATIEIAGLRVGGETFSADLEARGRLDADRDHGMLAAELTVPRLPWGLDGQPLPPDAGPSTLTADAKFSLGEKSLAVQSFELRSPLGNASGDAQLVFAPEIAVSASEVRLRDLPLERWMALMPPPLDRISGHGIMEADLQVRGAWPAPAVTGKVHGTASGIEHGGVSAQSFAFEAPVQWTGSKLVAKNISVDAKRLRTAQKGQWTISAAELGVTANLEQEVNGATNVAAQWRLGPVSFASADASRVGENVLATGRLEGRRDPAAAHTSITGKFVIERGEVLWGKFFTDLKSQQPSLEFANDYASASDALRVHSLKLSLAGAGQVGVRGTVERSFTNPNMRLEIRSDDLRPGGIFDWIIRPNFNRSLPVLDDLVLGGRVALAVIATGTTADLNVQGTIALRDGELQNKDKNWQVGPVRLDLPLHIQYPGKKTRPPPSAPSFSLGTLTVGAGRFGSEVIPAISARLSLWDNALIFRDPVRLPLYGGALEISDLAFHDIINTPRDVALSLKASDLQLERLTRALGWYEFGGSLSGSIPKMEWAGGILRSEGSIQVRVFGGEAQISTLEIDDPFSAIPSIRLNARFGNLSLEQASKTFAFGQISGVLEGIVNGLVITAGQPAAFQAEVHSVEKPGVSQRISVESLNKITVLSSGAEAGALYSGIASLFDSFRYSKLGFRASLKNDQLTLRGVESRPDGEYLVIGSVLPPTVNVVSHTQVIAFSELLRRLERVQAKSEGGKAPH